MGYINQASASVSDPTKINAIMWAAASFSVRGRRQV
jgi:hypothetical protein